MNVPIDIFLSYAREDRATARRFAQALEREGFKVWWDQTLTAGEAFDEVTENALTDARAVVVLWSESSVKSRWVRAEAAQADESGTLVPVLIEPCAVPIKFKLTHTADLCGWQGDPGEQAWQSFAAGLQRFTGVARSGSPGAPGATAVPVRRNMWRSAAAVLAAALLLAGGLLWWRPWHAASVHVASGGPSIAVLPFVNMSSDKEQEYFSDGLSEQLLNQLAQVPGLRVVGRTSSFAFKGRNEDLRKIGEMLGVNHVLEGSVRKASDRLKITAQLIDPADGSHLWSETYERKLDDIFAIQDEIAQTVAAQLQLKLGIQRADSGGTSSVAAYDEFLAARTLLSSADIGSTMKAAAGHLERAIEIDPHYLAARLWLIDDYMRLTLADFARQEEWLRRLDQVIDDVVRQSPDTPEADFALSYRVGRSRDLLTFERLLKRASTIPGVTGTRAKFRYGQFLAGVGQAHAAIAELAARVRDDPLDAFTRLQLAVVLSLSGEYERAAAEFNAIAGGPSADNRATLREALQNELARGDAARIQRALAELVAIPGVTPADRTQWEDLVDRSAASRRQLQERVAHDGLAGDIFGASGIAQQAEYKGDRALALRALSTMISQKFSFETFAFVLWRPLMRDLRKDPGFKQVAREAGLVDYWRATGNWGDFCRPVGADDFECD